MELGLSLGDTLSKSVGKDLGLCMSDPPVQLELLPLSPVHRRPSAKFPNFSWLADKVSVGVDSGEESDEEPSTTVRGKSGEDRGSEDENGIARKKLRLSKQQSAFLEDSFKEHNTLNPKQKVALAKQLNLRPRQVEVWFQNRRARTKLKQTEVDCEYLKRCCETLTEENRRLQKEVQELRALKANSQPFYMHPPPTTLTMCPSCEKQRLLTSKNNHFSL